MCAVRLLTRLLPSADWKDTSLGSWFLADTCHLKKQIHREVFVHSSKVFSKNRKPRPHLRTACPEVLRSPPLTRWSSHPPGPPLSDFYSSVKKNGEDLNKAEVKLHEHNHQCPFYRGSLKLISNPDHHNSEYGVSDYIYGTLKGHA